MAESLIRFMGEFMSESAKAAPLAEGELDKRIGALKTMFREVGNMTGDQFRETMTVAHFPQYFHDALSRMFFKEYTAKMGAWRNYCYMDSAPDFRDVRRFRMSRPGTLHLRREKAENKATYREEAYMDYAVDSYGEQFDVSWQTIQNDDLGEIKKTPMLMAEAARMFEDQFVSALYDNAVTQATLAGMGAPWSGTGRLTHPNLAIGLAAMNSRFDLAGNPVVVNSGWLVIPTILEIQAMTILQSQLAAGVATNDKNVLPGFIRGICVDPYMAWAGINVPWYLVADPAQIPTIPVLRLQGFDQPWVTKQASDIELISGSAPAAYMLSSFATGDIQYAVDDIIGGWDSATLVGVADPTGIYYSSGTTA
jgi:hypothetical protein